MTYSLEAGPSKRIVFPTVGPFDTQRGYTKVPQFSSRLESQDFRVQAQAHFSPMMAIGARLGISPPDRESDATGLVIRSQSGISLFDATPTQHLFKSYEDIPPLLVRSLTFIEDRDLGRPSVDDRANPV
jgi:membrane peptidoglycan carboxypeptidase